MGEEVKSVIVPRKNSRYEILRIIEQGSGEVVGLGELTAPPASAGAVIKQ
jgi:hypothetical protein